MQKRIVVTRAGPGEEVEHPLRFFADISRLTAYNKINIGQ